MTQHKKVAVYDLGLTLFREDVVRSTRIKERLISQLLSLVENDRRGERVNRRLVRVIVGMLVDLSKDAYKGDFEKPFLERTAEFYQRESAEILAEASAAECARPQRRQPQPQPQRQPQQLARPCGGCPPPQARRACGRLRRLTAMPPSTPPSPRAGT